MKKMNGRQPMTGLSAEPRLAAKPTDITASDARETLARNGRSFYWASRLLGRQMATDAAELYAFCRLLDDIADGDAAGGADRLDIIRCQLVRLDRTSLTDQPDPGLAACLPVIRRAVYRWPHLFICWTGCCLTSNRY